MLHAWQIGPPGGTRIELNLCAVCAEKRRKGGFKPKQDKLPWCAYVVSVSPLRTPFRGLFGFVVVVAHTAVVVQVRYLLLPCLLPSVWIWEAPIAMLACGTRVGQR